MAGQIKVHGKWEKLEVDPNRYLNDDFSSLISIEELTDYDFVKDGSLQPTGNVNNHSKPSKGSFGTKTPDKDSGAENKKKKKKASKRKNENTISDDMQNSVAEEGKPIRDPAQAGKKTLKKMAAKSPKKKIGRKRKGSVVSASNIVDVDSEEMASWVPGDFPKRKIVMPEEDEDDDFLDLGLSKKKKKKKAGEKETKGKKGQKQENVKTKGQNIKAVSKISLKLDPVEPKGKKAKAKQIKERKTEQEKPSINPQIVHQPKDIPFNDESDAGNKDMSAWKDLFVPDSVLKALCEAGFTSPTPIQALTLPSAIRDRQDILGAAETGSGKTLAFGIPLLSHILAMKARAQEEALQPDDGNQSDESDVSSIEPEGHAVADGEDITQGAASEEDDQLSEEDEDDQPDSGDDDDDQLDDDDDQLDDDDVQTERVIETRAPLVTKIHERPLYALILAPTRELAIQVRNHLQIAAKYTKIQVVAVVGGMAPQKQSRLLKRCPEIVVATPGRLWELLQLGDRHLAKMSDIRMLVIDEADRMVEKGHFEELSQLLELLNEENSTGKKRRQTFVFSATLTMLHSGPRRIMKKKKKFNMTEEQKLGTLMSHIGVREKPKIVDLTPTSKTVATLTEARINCASTDKDIYLYYFLLRHPGRTLVFANSKDCLRRLVSVLTLLKCCPLPLHADMHQRQRLKNLDKFKANNRGLLLATDVAARGLDIPDVQHVIHYQVPRTSENYVHRSGRTARALKEGLSVVFIGPEDAFNYRNIIKNINKDEELPLFPVEQGHLPGIKARVQLAREIDTLEHRTSKYKRENDWFEKAAAESEIVLDEFSLLHDLGDSREQSQQNRMLSEMRANLTSMLKEPIIRSQSYGKYPTKSGKLVVPYMDQDSLGGALRKMKADHSSDKKIMKKDFDRRQKLAEKKHEQIAEKKKKKMNKKKAKRKRPPQSQ